MKEKINKKNLLIGFSLIAAGVLVIGVGIALGSSVGGAALATALVI